MVSQDPNGTSHMRYHVEGIERNSHVWYFMVAGGAERKPRVEEISWTPLCYNGLTYGVGFSAYIGSAYSLKRLFS